MKRAQFFGYVQHDGHRAQLIIPDKESLAQRVWESLEGQLKQVAPEKYEGRVYVDLTFREDDKGKSNQLVRKFWKHLMPLIHKGMVDLGNDWEIEDSYAELKRMFLKPLKDGTYSIKPLGQRAFQEFYEKCERFGVQFLGLTIEPRDSNKYFPPE